MTEKVSIRNGFGKGLYEAAKKNKNVVALTADLKSSLKLDKVERDFPNQFFQFGISEQNMMSAAAGMCLNEKIPFVTSFASFNPGRNWDQLRCSVCYSNHNVKIIGGHAGLTTGEDGATHQCMEDLAITRVLPNLSVIVPCDEEEARQVTLWAAKHKGPVYIRLSREKVEDIYLSREFKFKFGKGQVLERGDDITIIACGTVLQFVLKAYEKLKKVGINATVVNMSTVKPIDKKLIVECAKKTKCVLVCEEHQIYGGLGGTVSEVLSREFPVFMDFVGMNDKFGESGKGYELLEKYKISTSEIVKKAKNLVLKKN